MASPASALGSMLRDVGAVRALGPREIDPGDPDDAPGDHEGRPYEEVRPPLSARGPAATRANLSADPQWAGCAGLPLYLSRVRGLTDRSPGKVLLLTTWACGLFLLAFALFAGFTVGVFYLPAAASLLLVGLVSLIRSIIMGDSDDAPSRDPDTLG